MTDEFLLMCGIVKKEGMGLESSSRFIHGLHLEDGGVAG